MSTTSDLRHRRGARMLAVSAGLAGALAATSVATAAPARPATAPAGVVCATPPAYGPGGGMGPQYGLDSTTKAPQGNPGKVTLSRNQLLINQRISQAAILRVNAVQKWLDGGIVGTDICGGALNADNLGAMRLTTEAPGDAKKAPTPRALEVGKVGGGDVSKVQLSRDQLLINQRISQEAVRRSNALRDRLDGKLTAGDIKDGTITQNNLAPGLRVLGATPVVPAPAASKTVLAPKKGGDASKVTLSRNQMLINQRISQAAVRRSNVLMAHIRTGLNGADFMLSGVTAADLAPGTVRP